MYFQAIFQALCIHDIHFRNKDIKQNTKVYTIKKMELNEKRKKVELNGKRKDGIK